MIFFHKFRFYNPKTSKNRMHSLIFSDYRIRTPTEIQKIGQTLCNMDSHSMNNINIPNSHPSILSLLVVLSKKIGFRVT